MLAVEPTSRYKPERLVYPAESVAPSWREEVDPVPEINGDGTTTLGSGLPEGTFQVPIWTQLVTCP